MGALRRAAPVPAIACSFPKRSRGAAPTARSAMAQGSSSSVCRPAGANKKPSVPGSSYVKVVRNGVSLEMEVIPVGVSEMLPNGRPISKQPSTRRISADQKLPAPSPKHAKVTRPFMKRPHHQVVETAACGATAGEKSARRAGADEEILMPSPKRSKVSPSGVEASVGGDAALGTLRKRMAAELDAVHALLRKAELLSSTSSKKARFMAASKPRSETPAEASVKTPAAKQSKVPALATIVKFQSTKDEHESINICGGVSPVAILKSSPVIAVEKAGETGANSESTETPEDGNKIVDVPVVSIEKAGESGNSPSSSSSDSDSGSDSGSSSSSDSDSDSDTGSSSSSDSDSDSDTESDPDENGAPLQPAPEPASEVGQSTETEKISKAVLIAKANLRRTLLEMEKAVLPDESILPQDLKDLCIVEYGRASIMQKLGLFLKADA